MGEATDRVATTAVRYTSFPTAIGTCAVAWTEKGLYLLHLPGANTEQTIRSLVARLGTGAAATSRTAAPAWVQDALSRITRHLDGEPQDFRDVPLDLERVAPFRRKVYELARSLPSGRTTTYGELASKAGAPGGARAVGQSMAQNPLPVVIPCHRVLAAGNAIGGFSAPGGTDTKLRLLEIERRAGAPEEAGSQARLFDPRR